MALALAAFAAGCGGAEPEPPEPDAALVDALVELHLADAVADLDTTATTADSVRAAALAAHGLDSAALAARLDALAADPGAVEATYDAVTDRLVAEREGAAR